MKKLIILIMLLFAVPVLAATNVTFHWDANTEPDMAGYNIYRSDVSGSYGISNLVGTVAHPGVEFTEAGVPDGKWYWVSTAFDTYGNESEYSNELTDTLNTVAPAPPQNLRIWQKIIAWVQHFFYRG